MFLKIALGLLLTLPLGAYIAGTLVASQVDMPPERAPVVIEASPAESPAATPANSPSPSPSRSPDDETSGHGDDDDDDDRSGSGHGDDDDDVRIVRPTPREVDEDALEDRADDLADEREDRADDLADEREDRTDDSGHGSGGD
jgi:hypothetical protein